MDLGLEGRACVVTGASRGIGLAAAERLCGEGARVVLVGRSAERLEEALARCLAAGGPAEVLELDVTEPDAGERMVAAASEPFGGLDVLVNNAGVFAPHPITETSYEQWQRGWQHTLGVNLVGAANVTWCAVQHMAEGGHIVNVASRGAFRGEPTHPAYGASKAGLIAFGQSLARALGPRGIAVTAVAPGFTETDMAGDELVGEKGEKRRAESPLGRVAKPEEVAAAVVFLASPEAVMASGTVIDVNGASYLRM
jgi:NAD(P)-dependent dehydrogenase (short-subunit alcohol dehydrogenase family)